MNITYYGHACFEAVVNGKKLLFDPFISDNPLAKAIDVNTQFEAILKQFESNKMTMQLYSEILKVRFKDKDKNIKTELEKVSKEIFGDLPQLISFEGENGITRYLTGNYASYKEAAKAKIDILLKGFEGAFIVAYKGGKRIALQSLGVDMLQKETIDDSESEKEMNGITKNKIYFTIQIGNFKNDVPADLLNKFVSIKDIDVDKLPSGNTRYTVGNYPDYAAALVRKNDLVNNYKLDGAFIIAFFNGRQIDMNEAKELLNK